MTKTGVGFSEKTNSREAGAEAVRLALEQAKSDRCDVVMLFATSKHDPLLIREGIRSVVGQSPRLFGGSANGVITNEKIGYAGYQVGAAVIASDSIEFDMFLEPGLPDNEYEVGKRLGEQIRAAGDGDGSIIFLYDMFKNRRPAGGMSLNMAMPLLRGMTESLRAWPPAAGAGITGDMQWNQNFQWFEDRVEQQSAMALVLSGDARLDTTTIHGYKPASRYYTVTRAEKNNVLELDGKPTVEVVKSLLDVSALAAWADYPLFFALGVNHGDKFADYREEDYSVRACMDIDWERGGLLMFGDDMAEGTEVQIMRMTIDMDRVRSRAAALFQCIGNRKAVLALYIDCCGRGAAYCGTDGEEAREIQRAIDSRVPLLGWYVGCEIAKTGSTMQMNNITGILCVLSE